MDKIDLFHNSSEIKVDLQIDLIKELKNRAGVILGFNIVFLSIIFTNNKSLFEGVNRIPLYFILFSTFLLFCCLFVTNFSRSPEPSKFYTTCKNKKIRVIKEHLIEELNEDFKDNKKQIGSLRTLINLAIWIELISIMFLTTNIFPII